MDLTQLPQRCECVSQAPNNGYVLMKPTGAGMCRIERVQFIALLGMLAFVNWLEYPCSINDVLVRCHLQHHATNEHGNVAEP